MRRHGVAWQTNITHTCCENAPAMTCTPSTKNQRDDGGSEAVKLAMMVMRKKEDGDEEELEPNLRQNKFCGAYLGDGDEFDFCCNIRT